MLSTTLKHIKQKNCKSIYLCKECSVQLHISHSMEQRFRSCQLLFLLCSIFFAETNYFGFIELAEHSWLETSALSFGVSETGTDQKEEPFLITAHRQRGVDEYWLGFWILLAHFLPNNVGVDNIDVSTSPKSA